MPYPVRKIGDCEVSAIGLGCMGLSSFYGTEWGTDEERFKVLDRAWEIGCRHWDSADVYNDSEELLGKWFRRTGKRSDIFLTTKFGFTKEHSVRGDPEYVKERINSSLARFGVDTIDLVYQHRVDPKVPIEETVRAMAEFVKAGKVKYIGLSECSSAALRRAHAVHPISVVQFEYSPFEVEIEEPGSGILQTARELGIKIVAYSPLGRGLLTGQYKSMSEFSEGDFRQYIPKFHENFPNILAVANELKAIGAKHNATAAQIAIAWVLAQGDDFIPIPGTTKIKYLEENFAAANIKLSNEEIQAVRHAHKNAGFNSAPRYPQMAMQQLNLNSPIPDKA